jgi:predicted short-subunit dehydrogenase-like oxidoreductase (DUF2520 family)
MEPVKAQTGPAVRYDHNVIEKHLDTLEDFPEFKKIYKMVSESIYKFHQNT